MAIDAIDRRMFLVGCGAAVAVAARADSTGAAIADADQMLYAAARRDANGRHSAAIFTAQGRDVNAVHLPGRGHDVAVCPTTRRCVVFARRPGNFAVAFSADRSTAPLSFTTPPDRHFYGHGIFSRDGRLLYATENDFEAGRGVVGLYDATDGFRRVGEFPSHGIGPHDMALLNRAPVLVVANGGLREHPDFGGGRRVLNPESIETSLAYIDLRSGDLIERHIYGKEQLSLRHLDVAPDDTVVLGAQAHGSARDEAMLIFRHRRQHPLHAYGLEAALGGRLRGYVSSVAIGRSGAVAAITSAPGSIAVFLDVATGNVLRTMTAADVAGITPTAEADTFLATTGEGVIRTVSASDGHPESAVSVHWSWDNHAISLARS